MARNNMRNIIENPKYTDLIPLGVFSVRANNNGNSDTFNIDSMVILENDKYGDKNISYNAAMDKFFIFRNKKLYTEFNLYWNNGDPANFELSYENGELGKYHPELAVMVHPSTIYKINKITFENNPMIRVVHDLYMFNSYDFKGIFKNCTNMVLCDIDNFEPSVIIYNVDAKFDYAFANCFSLLHGPQVNTNSVWWKYNRNDNVTVSMNYALMNTKDLRSDTFFNNFIFNVDKCGGKGIFLNSVLNSLPKLNLSNVYDLRNTFDQAKPLNGISKNYTLDITAAKSIEGIFKDSQLVSYLTLNNANNLINANSAFKGNNTIQSVIMNNSSLLSALEIFSGCILLADNPQINFENMEFVIDTFRNCEKINNFYITSLNNAKIASGIYENCKNLTGLSNILNDNEYILDLSNASIISNIFKNCSGLKNEVIDNNNTQIKVSTDIPVIADGLFEGCSSLTDHIHLENEDSVVSSICMYKDCGLLNDVGTNEFINSLDKSGMYKGCKLLETFNLNKSPLIASSMFEDCSSLNGGNFCLDEAKMTVNTFKNCSNITNTNVTFSNTTSESVNVSGMYEGCIGLTSTPDCFSSLNTENMVGTFKGCRNIIDLDIQMDTIQNMASAFYGCNSLANINFITNGSSFNRFPRIDIRGTNISDDAFYQIANDLPDMSHHINYTGKNLLSGMNWTSLGMSDLIYTTTSNFRTSLPLDLVPGLYRISIPDTTASVGIWIMKITDNGNEVISSCIENNKYSISMDVYIDEEASYYICGSTTNSALLSQVLFIWAAPYYSIDIRNTPAETGSNIASNVGILNNKGWQVLMNNVMADDLTDIAREIKNNYLENINMHIIDDENDIWTTDEFDLPAGYYNLYSESNNSDKFKVYKVNNNGGEYPIAMSYEKDYTLCFETINDFKIRIKFRHESNDLILKKI